MVCYNNVRKIILQQMAMRKNRPTKVKLQVLIKYFDMIDSSKIKTNGAKIIFPSSLTLALLSSLQSLACHQQGRN